MGEEDIRDESILLRHPRRVDRLNTHLLCLPLNGEYDAHSPNIMGIERYYVNQIDCFWRLAQSGFSRVHRVSKHRFAGLDF